MTTLIIPQKIKKEIKQVSISLGISTNDLILNSVLYYMKRIKDRIDLKYEMDSWELTGVEDLSKNVWS
ncbi:MAG: hypothetical protein AAB636_01525 [Patescibacteria group bacterium]